MVMRRLNVSLTRSDGSMPSASILGMQRGAPAGLLAKMVRVFLLANMQFGESANSRPLLSGLSQIQCN
jgi:hypothetical protein